MSPGRGRMGSNRALGVLLVLAALRAGQAAPLWPPWPRPVPGGEQLDSAWERTLNLLWGETKDRIGFCVGRSQWKVQRLASLSFPWPLPVTADASDALCSNSSRIDLHLCDPLEIKQYYKFMLLTDNPEQIPDTPHCTAGASGGQPACSPGFFDERWENRPLPVAEQRAHACCEGYFCPPQLTCMIPCPLGSYCPRARPAQPPPDYSSGTGDTKWCAPYAYKQRQDLGCGGADKWRIVPGSAFPTAWWSEGSGSIYCDGGHYCPNTTTQLDCAPGHFCRQGSTEPERCPPGAACPANTEISDTNYAGVTVDAMLFGALWLAWMLSQQYNRVLRQLSRRERLKVTWGAAPQVTVVQAAPRCSTFHSRTDSDRQAAPESSEPAVAAGLPRQGNARMRGASGRAVWASFRGPDAAADGGYEPLPDEQQQEEGGQRGEALHSEGGSRESVELSPPHRQLPAVVGSPAAAALASPPALHGRQVSLDCNDDDMTPHRLHSRLVAQHRQSLLSSPLSSMHAGAGARKRELCIEFQELGLRLKSCGKPVLAGVTGVLRAAHITAIMGPSGAGKTTLLNTLAGKAQAYGTQAGSIFVNGRPDRLERYKRVMGFVPQDDIMHSTLTVYENLLFSARYRLPARCSRGQRLYQVERAISVLQLDDVRDELIGDEETRGISGGQRKRVNVGLELVADPSLLFLDEPTSGLDSTASKALVAALQAVVRSGVTAAAVIHQPSWETCLLFDELLLLGKGGRTVYYGSVGGVQAYFLGLGFHFPAQQNPADAFMDFISGSAMRPGQASAAELFDLWDDHCGRPRKPAAPAGPAAAAGARAASAAENGQGEDAQGPLLVGQGSSEALLELEGGAAGEAQGQLLGDAVERRSWKRRAREALIFAGAYLAAGASNAWRTARQGLWQADAALIGGRLFARKKRAVAATDGVADESGGGDAAGGSDSWRESRRRTTPGFLPTFYWCLGRAALKRTREPLSVLTDYAIFALTGMTLGLISDRGRETIMHFAVSITYSVVALGLLSTVGALNTFGRDRVVFYRESASGLNRLAHFLALDTFDHGGTVMRSAVYFIMYYSFASPRAVIWQMLLVSIGITYCCTGVAYLLSQVMEPSAAQLSAATLALINTLVARQGHPRGLLRLAQAFSFARWGLEGYVIAESNKLTGVWLLARCADLMGLEYDVRRFGLCLLALFGLGMMFRAAALVAMLSLHRDKQR